MKEWTEYLNNWPEPGDKWPECSSRVRWETLCENWLGPEEAESIHAKPLFDCLVALYSHPPRAYHSLSHIEYMLICFDDHVRLAKEPMLVEFAIWLHDCVHQMDADDEKRSSDIAATFLKTIGGTPKECSIVRNLILATQHVVLSGDYDEMLIADLDLVILAAPVEIYDQYAHGISVEYCGRYTQQEVKEGRQKFLRSFLKMPFIFQTPEFQESYEQLARDNLYRELNNGREDTV